MASLDVAIVGAGIAGLAAAIALRRGGHKATIFERSHQNNEVGAAITTSPYATRISQSWGLSMPRGDGTTVYDGRGTVLDGVRFLDPQKISDGQLVSFGDCVERYGAPYVSYHRADLHATMKRKALDLGAEILLGREVVDLDCATGSLTVKVSGPSETVVIKKSLIVVADGTNSRFAPIIAGEDIPLDYGPKCMYRSLVSTESLRGDATAMKLFPSGEFTEQKLLVFNDRIALCYPCREGEVMNIAVAAKRNLEIYGDDWHTPASMDELADVLEGFQEPVLAMSRHSTEIKVYNLLCRKPWSRYVNGRALMIGDAAHPMYPALAAAGAIALEDAAALEPLLKNLPSSNANSNDADATFLADRLRLWELVRLPRSATVQVVSNAQFEPQPAKNLTPQVASFLNQPLPQNVLLGLGPPTREFLNHYDVFVAVQNALDWWEAKFNREGSAARKALERIDVLEREDVVTHFGVHASGTRVKS